ncbi:hypothetical protein GWK91_00340 [Virgibacillus sp. MSP4-1]|uniref:hypothetical protein n=1 Tax=Virgibacillus sp. MSP4-1 TaxID=2700081 RepID=UPI0003A14E5C|nr:hypothetical protein [Virgibacillus sp. MSP4-1]QHS21498.1 hypothetical protein GWK91_00340 [Virgibacillus sp. MSP4-1]
MNEAVDDLNFKRARERNTVTAVEAALQNQATFVTDFSNRDVIGYCFQDEWICIYIFYIREGKMTDREFSIFQTKADSEAVFCHYIRQFYTNHPVSLPNEVLLPNVVYTNGLNIPVKMIQPQRGTMKQLVQLACKNAYMKLQWNFSLIELGK